MHQVADQITHRVSLWHTGNVSESSFSFQHTKYRHCLEMKHLQITSDCRGPVQFDSSQSYTLQPFPTIKYCSESSSLTWWGIHVPWFSWILSRKFHLECACCWLLCWLKEMSSFSQVFLVGSCDFTTKRIENDGE